MNTSKTISSLHPNYVYRCEVHIFTVRNGPPSEAVYINTFEDGKLFFRTNNMHISAFRRPFW
jgi:hypothetical protein